MAIFTAIGATIAGWIGLTGTFATIAGVGLSFAGTLVAGVIAGGLGLATSKMLGVFKPPSMANAKDPGVKVQVAPGTDNKVPVFYGSNLTGGLIVDAGISNSNDTMTYVIVLGEKTDTGTYTIGKQYRGDNQLNFGSLITNSHIVQSVTDANATASTDVAGKMRCRIYAGGTASTDQIFPASGNQVAATAIPGISTITATTSYEGLVYAVFQIDYDQENGLTDLGAYTVEITNSLSEPGVVLNDFLLNSRYGAGLSASDIDATSIAALTTYCEEQVAYTPDGGGSAYHNRWAINGMMGTYNNVFQTIDLICQSCSTFFTYNPKVGKFEVVPNREATTLEKSNAYLFDDENLLGAIDVTSTQLYAQYNEIEAEFPDGTERDQTSTIYINTPAGELNANEPTNKLTTRYPIVNDAPRVTNLAQIDLRQSRKDLVVQLKADYEAIQTDVGDIVKLTNATYGFTEKLFRVMRVTETEAEDGMLSVSLVLLEYDDSVYAHETVSMTGDLPATGIPGYIVTFGNSLVAVGNITVADNQNNVAANIVYSGNNASTTTTINYADIVLPMAPSSGDIGGPFLSVPVTPATGTFWPQVQISVTPVMKDATEGAPTVNIYGQSLSTFFPGDVTTNLGIDLKFMSNNQRMANVSSVRLAVTGSNPYLGVTSLITETANITFNAENFVANEAMNIYGAGAQLEEANLYDLNMSNLNVVSEIIAPIEFDVTGVDLGTYSFSVAGTPIGSTDATTVQTFQLVGNANVEYANTTTTATDSSPIVGTPTTYSGPGRLPARLDENTEIIIDPTNLGITLNLDDLLLPTAVNFGVNGINTLDQTPSGDIGYNDIKVSAIKITKNIRP